MAAQGSAGRPITRRRWGSGLVAGGATALLAACALPGGVPGSGGSGGGGGAAPGGGPAPGAPCTQPLELLISWDGTTPINAALRKTVNEFSATRGRCGVQLTPVSPWGADTLAAGLAAGSAPPLTLLTPTAVATWGPQGLIEPLDAQFKGAKLSAGDFFPPVWETMSFQGKVWHLPLQVDPNFPLFWNKAVLRQAGFDPDRPPATVDALDQMAQALSTNADGQWERLGFVPWGWYGLANSLTTAAYMFGGSFYDKSRDRVSYNHPQVVKAVDWMAGWAQRLGLESVNQTLAGSSPARSLAAGKLAFQPLVSIDIPAARGENPDLELGYGPLPASAPGQAGAVWTGGWHIAAVPGSKRLDDAWELLRWIGASDEGTLSVARNMGGLPGYAKSPGLGELAKDPNTAAHVDAIKGAKFLPPSFYVPVTLDYAPLDEALTGRRSAKSALDELTGQAQQKLDQLGTQQQQRQGQGRS